MNRSLLLIASTLGFLSVALGAFGAHGLKTMLSGHPDVVQRLAHWETGVRYQMFHTIALGILAILASHVAGSVPKASAAAFVLGIVVFSGSLYIMTLTGLRWLGAITPIGGVAFLVGWVLMGWAAWQLR